MLYGEYRSNFPTGKIDYGEWILSPEGRSERHLTLIQQRERLEYKYQTSEISQEEIKELEEFYQKVILDDFPLSIVPWFIRIKESIMNTIYEKSLTSFIYGYGGNDAIIFLNAQGIEIDREMFLQIVDLINEVNSQSKNDFIEASKLLDEQPSLLNTQDKLNLVESNITFMDGVASHIPPPTIISLLVHSQSTEKEIINLIANHSSCTVSGAHSLFTDTLSRHPNISKAYLIKSFRNERLSGDNSVNAVQRLIFNFNLSKEQVIESIIATKQSANPKCSMPSLPKNIEELVVFAIEEHRSLSEKIEEEALVTSSFAPKM